MTNQFFRVGIGDNFEKVQQEDFVKGQLEGFAKAQQEEGLRKIYYLIDTKYFNVKTLRKYPKNSLDRNSQEKYVTFISQPLKHFCVSPDRTARLYQLYDKGPHVISASQVSQFHH